MNHQDGASGISRIRSAFAAARAGHRATLMPYFTLGYPDPMTSVEIIEAIARSGADLIELGVPFSDPLADGRTIQHSTQVALAHGMSLARCLELTGKLRLRGVTQPLLLMSYVNPILAYGVERFASEAARAGTDGCIVPDLPPEEAGPLEIACSARDLALIYLVAPTSTSERLRVACQRARGFVYLVSVSGITGARDGLPPDLEGFIRRVRAVTETPLAVGFGIATPSQARAVSQLADGVIVGSALIDAVRAAAESADPQDNPVLAAASYVRALREAMPRKKDAQQCSRPRPA